MSNNTKTGRFRRISQGIYRLNHSPSSPFEDLFFAWLRTDPKSVISHESALAVYEMSYNLPGNVHVNITHNASRRHQGIKLHTNRLKHDEIIMREGLPITTVSRTITDVARGGLAEEQIRRAIREALQKGLTTREAHCLQAERHRGRAAQVILQVIKESMDEIR